MFDGYGFIGAKAYKDSKLCNILFAVELMRQARTLTLTRSQTRILTLTLPETLTLTLTPTLGISPKPEP